MTHTENRETFFISIVYFLLLSLLSTTQIKSINLSEAKINFGLIKKDQINADLLRACSKALEAIKQLKTLRQAAAQYERQRTQEGFKLLEKKGVVKRRLREIYEKIHALKAALTEQQNEIEIMYQSATRRPPQKNSSLSNLNFVINFIFDHAEYLRQCGDY